MLGVLDHGLQHRQFVASDKYSIADIAHFGWLWRHQAQIHKTLAIEQGRALITFDFGKIATSLDQRALQSVLNILEAFISGTAHRFRPSTHLFPDRTRTWTQQLRCQAETSEGYTTIYNRFNRWSRQGIWLSLFKAITGNSGVIGTASIDSSHVKVHRSAGGGKGGPSSKPSDAREGAARPRSMR